MIDAEPRSAEPTESPVRFGVLVAIGVTLLFQFGAQLVLLRFEDVSLLPFVTAFSQLTLMLLPAVFAARAQELATSELFRLHKVPLAFHVATIVGIIALLQIVQTYLIVQELYLVPEALYNAYRELQQRLQELYDRLLPAGGMMAPVLSLFAGALVPGICEEFVFRGATQRSFERRMRPHIAIVLTSLLFAALHLQPHNFVPLVILGLFLGLVAWSSGSIYPSVVGHFLFNAVMVGALYTMRASGELPAGHSESDLIALAPGVVASLIGLAFVVRWFVRRGRARVPSGATAIQTTPTTDPRMSVDEH